MGVELPVTRPRRLRQNAAVRAMVAETRLHPRDFVLPVFVKEGATAPAPISSMPGVVQHSLDSLVDEARACVAAGVGGFMIFGVPTTKDAVGSGGDDPDGILNVAVARVREAVGDDLVVMADLCLDEFTDHGHCGVLDEQGRVDNDATLERYAAMAVAQARAGAHAVGPSGMMDGQVRVVRSALDEAGFIDTIVFAYSAKYASGFYGPFREAVESSLVGDRRPTSRTRRTSSTRCARSSSTSTRAPTSSWSSPRLPNLDVVRAATEIATVPVAAYQISGEYSMIEAAAERGWIDRRRCALEALTSIKRAGAQITLTYYAREAAAWLGA